jgi:hypothetical protein
VACGAKKSAQRERCNDLAAGRQGTYMSQSCGAHEVAIDHNALRGPHAVRIVHAKRPNIGPRKGKEQRKRNSGPKVWMDDSFSFPFFLFVGTRPDSLICLCWACTKRKGKEKTKNSSMARTISRLTASRLRAKSSLYFSILLFIDARP